MQITAVKKKLLWVGDAACPSGFARATHEILDTLRHYYDVTALGINYNGDPAYTGSEFTKYHVDGRWPYPIYTCFPGGDVIGYGRLAWLCDRVQPDVIVLQNDGWNIPFYMEQWAKRHKHIPVVAAVAVDGKNFNGAWLKDVSLAIFWTQFALDEARLGGYAGPASVIPLGVDTTNYRPVDTRAARSARGLDQIIDAFIVGNVNRNQVRKRWDLTLRYFAKWVKGVKPGADDGAIRTMPLKIEDAWLYLHTAPTGDEGVDVKALATYYGIRHRLALLTPDTFYGITEEQMRDTYNSFDAQISTTQGEGFGFTTFEGMSCGVPQIAPRWSALEDLCDDAAVLVPCTSTALNATYSGTIGGVADEAAFIGALDRMYREAAWRDNIAWKGRARANEARFKWANIGQRYVEALDEVLNPITLRIDGKTLADAIGVAL
jgi:D-inositol-3-phosphate glycosyltransferase